MTRKEKTPGIQIRKKESGTANKKSAWDNRIKNGI